MTEKVEFSRPRRLEASDNLEHFSCSQPALDDWLEKFAFSSQQSGMTTVYISKCSNDLAGFYALSTGGVAPDDAPDRIRKGVARHPIPVVILTRLAVDARFQGMGLGRLLVRDALLRVEAASKEVGIRSLLIHAKDVAARDFYLSLAEFEPSPTDPFHLHLLMKDLRKTLVSSV